jgi:glycosyltransferase involved in cell wall biosynthesis
VRIAFLAFHGSVHTRRWVSWFAQRGHDVHVVTCGDDAELEFDGQYEVHDLGIPRLGKLGYVAKVPAVRRVIRSLDADLVHAHQATSYGALALACGARPYVVTAHGSDILLAPRNPVFRTVLRPVLRGASLVTVPSEQMRDTVYDLAGTRPRVLTFQYGVDTALLAAIADDVRGSVGHGERPLGVASARPLFRLYHFESLVEALGLLRDRGVVVTCDLYDDGPERASLLSSIESLGLDGSVSLHGFEPERVVLEALARSDVYVSLAESDGASIALLEAMALGAVPVLADIPANRAWVRDGENGILTRTDPVSVADAIERAATLDRAGVAAENLALVATRADRETNLTMLERELETMVAAGRGVDRSR